MKKLFKIFGILLVIFIVLIAGALLTLKIMFPASKLKAMAQDYVTKNYNREIDFKDVSFNIIGVSIEDFKFSEKGGFAAGEFVSAKEAIVKVEFMPLLSKQVKIDTIGFDGVEINVIKDKDGVFNFDDLIPADKSELSAPMQEPQEDISAQEAAPMAIDLTAQAIYIKNSNVHYKDLQGDSAFSVKDVNFSIKDFDYNNPFSYVLSLATSLKAGDIKVDPLLLSSKGMVNIAGLALEKASANIEEFTVAYKDFNIKMSGSAENFAAPSAKLKGSISGINDKLAKEFVSSDMPPFALPVINIGAEASMSSDTKASDGATVKLDIGLGKSYINTNAFIDLSKEELAYEAESDINVNLSDISDIAKEMLAQFQLKGSVGGKLSVASAKDMPLIKGSISLKDLGAAVMEKSLSKLNGTVTINSIDNIKTNIIKGVFDGSDFKTSLAYKKSKKMSVDFMFDMDKFTLDDIDFNALMASSNEEEKAEAPAETEKEEASASTASDLQMEPMDIKTDIIIRRIENNVFSTDNLTLKADIKNLDLAMTKATGTLSFAAYDGEIRDLDKIINSFVLMKVVFTTVKIAQKALKTLDLVSGGQINTDSVKYKSILGDYTFNNGIATVKKSDLNSDLATVNTTGTVNFATEKLDMKIKVGLGKNASSSAAVKVGGTINEPSFKLDVASTVGSLLGGGSDSSAKEAVEDVKNTVKDVAGGIKNLFKKK